MHNHPRHLACHFFSQQDAGGPAPPPSLTPPIEHALGTINQVIHPIHPAWQIRGQYLLLILSTHPYEPYTVSHMPGLCRSDVHGETDNVPSDN